MGILGFLASVADNFNNHYIQLANSFRSYSSPRLSNHSRTTQPPLPDPVRPDRYEPSRIDNPTSKIKPDNITKSPSKAERTYDRKPDSVPSQKPSDEYIPQKEKPSSENKPDGTYYFKRTAKLDYKLDLRFDLGAITSTVRSISEGDTEQIEKLVAAGFGLHADFNLSGKQTVKTNLLPSDNPEVNGRSRSLSRFRSRQASRFNVQSRDFALQAFSREAVKIRRSQDISTSGGYQRAVNKLSMRFKLDSSFSFAHLKRFNVQTNRVAKEAPDVLPQYIDSVGNVAQTGTSEMMATFFDAVDAYLDKSEDQLLDKVVSFFDQAADELGFSGTMVDMARNQLTGAIETFFNRVDTALAGIQSQFVPDEMTQPTMPVGEPKILPTNNIDPAIAQDSQQLAIA